MFIFATKIRNTRYFIAYLCGSLFLCMQVLAQTPISVIPFSSDLEYGIIANENGICRMNDRGSLIGLNGQSCLGSGSRAVFDIRGEPGYVIYIGATGSSQSGITFTPKLSGSATKVISSRGNTIAVLAGDLTLNNPSSGKHALNYIICIYYE